MLSNQKSKIVNLRQRLNLVRNMQVFGIGGLLFCVISMFDESHR
jgi:hypothetical protein